MTNIKANINSEYFIDTSASKENITITLRKKNLSNEYGWGNEHIDANTGKKYRIDPLKKFAVLPSDFKNAIESFDLPPEILATEILLAAENFYDRVAKEYNMPSLDNMRQSFEDLIDDDEDTKGTETLSDVKKSAKNLKKEKDTLAVNAYLKKRNNDR